jgi:hypothetical protein
LPRRLLIVVAVLAIAVAGVRLSGRLQCREIAVAVPGLPHAFQGLRIGVVSDLHRSAVVSERQCRRAAALLGAARCDLIVNLGDNVTRRAGYAPSAVAGFRAVRPPLGKLAVLGNHDHWTNAAEVSRALERAGFRVLVNQNVALRRGGQAIYIIGLDDLWASASPRVAKAFDGVPPGACAIVLSHNPDAIYERPVRGAALVLSGHTHGGQVLSANRLVPNCRYGRLHPHGLYRAGKTQIYVTSGVGVISPPIRLGVPPEVAVITLRRAQGVGGTG